MGDPIRGVFGVAPGVDFPAALLAGLEQRLTGAAPHDWAQVEIYVNTRRMQRRLLDLFDLGPARLLPKIGLVSDLSHISQSDLPNPVPPLRRRLELTQLIDQLLQSQPDLAPKSALYDLADSLAALMDEMHSEGVSPQVLHELDVSHLSEHWARTRQFLTIVEQYFGEEARQRPDREAHTRLAIEQMVEHWQKAPPDHPVIIAGSTGSRGATALLMQAVAGLPQGALVLPGFDFDMPQVWGALDDALTAEDHPQFRFARLLGQLEVDPKTVQPWHNTRAPNPGRNRLVSLALRPAPVTDQWLTEGSSLGALEPHCDDLTLIEAPSPRAEANAIAMCLRNAVERQIPAALITPDRVLTRQVTAALDRWGIEPDDSAGMPLQLSAPGRFLRHVAGLIGQPLTAEALLSLLKHPLTASGAARGEHLRFTRELELHLRRYGPAFPTALDLAGWSEKIDTESCTSWASWLGALLDPLAQVGTAPLQALLEMHLAAAQALAAGPEGVECGDLWDKPAGKAARATCDELLAEAPYGGTLHPAEYADLFRAVLSQGADVHDPIGPHPGVMIWGTLEARVQGADLVILAGLNEGSWPQVPAPDPWLNRDMRKRAGLLLPERRIGLAAHDFQQAIAAKEVVITRAIRDAESETVPARWLNRLTNLLSGLPNQGGTVALNGMRARGQIWLDIAAALEAPTDQPALTPRPAPSPPIHVRPKQLSVTRIQTLIRNPYAIYAERVLGLRALDPLRAEPNAAQRGTVLHEVMEKFIAAGVADDAATARDDLLRLGDEVLNAHIPWPTARRMWRARLARIADWFIDGEHARQAEGIVAALEQRGAIRLPNGFELTAEADRIDRLNTGDLVVYDYKTGQVPTRKQMDAFDQQLFLEAAMVARGGFTDLRGSVARVAHIGLGSSPKLSAHTVGLGDTDQVIDELTQLIDAFEDRGLGYQARRAVYDTKVGTDYDHLSRFGEWEESDPAQVIEVGE